MSDDGYVLADVMAALAVISLTMGGTLAGAALLAKVQARTDLETAKTAGLKRVSVALGDLLGQAGPFRSRDAHFDGEAQAFDFACGARRCGARLVKDGQDLSLEVTRASGEQETIALRGVDDARFAYVGALGAGDTWPRWSAKPDRLRQLTLLQTPGEAPLAQAALPIDQPMVCEFDVVSQDCR